MSAQPLPGEPGTVAGETLREAVAGERGPTQVLGSRSIQAKLHQGMAILVMLLLGGGALGFYYWHWAGEVRERNAARSREQKIKANTEMRLPKLAGINDIGAKSTVRQVDLSTSAPEIPLTPGEMYTSTSASDAVGPGGLAGLNRAGAAGPPKPEPLLDAPVMWREQRSTGATAENGAASAAPVGEDTGTLGQMLQATSFAPVAAHRLPTQRLLLPKGASIDCTLQTAIDSTLPGITTCITAVDVFGADGRVVLLERGTALVGETKSEIKQGQARIFVIWSEARTPTGVVIPLGSPGTDALGRAGLAGGYDTHFQERFGAAILVSVIDGAIQAGVAAQRSGSNGVLIDTQAPREVMTEVMKKTIAIPPTITVNQGSRVAVLVARDVDFRGVYALKVAN